MSTPTLPSHPNSAWIFQAWASFAVSLGAMLLTIATLDMAASTRALMALGCLYLTTSCFTLAKTVRDQQEVERLVSRVDEAKVERLLAEQNLTAF